MKHVGRAGKPEPVKKAGGKRGKYGALAGKDALLDTVKACVDQGMAATQIYRDHTKGGVPLRTIQRYVTSLKAGMQLSAARGPGGGRKAKCADLSARIKENLSA